MARAVQQYLIVETRTNRRGNSEIQDVYSVSGVRQMNGVLKDIERDGRDLGVVAYELNADGTVGTRVA